MNAFAVASILLLAAGPLQENRAWKLTPRMLTGQEVVYRGTITEIGSGTVGATFQQQLHLQASMLVLDIDAKRNAEIGCYTLVRLPDGQQNAKPKDFENVARVHFDLVRVSPTGEPTWATSGAQILPSANGSTSGELGYFIEVPKKAVAVGAEWTIRRPGQPAIHCAVTGTGDVLGISCVEVVCKQQTPNWLADDPLQSEGATSESTKPGSAAQTTPRLGAGGIASWSQTTKALIDLKTGMVRRLHREFRGRRPGETRSHRTVIVDYQHASDYRYGGSMLQEHVSDFRAGFKAQSQLEVALTKIDQQRRPLLQQLKGQLEYALEQFRSTPYRPAMAEMLRLVEQVESHPVDAEPATLRISGGNRIGRKARNFIVRNLEKDESITLTKLKGRHVLLVFVDPTSPLSKRAFSTIIDAVRTQEQETVLVMAACTQTEQAAVERLRDEVEGNYIICSAGGLEKAYKVDAVPHTVLIDAEGVLRGQFIGFGPETFPAIVDALAQQGKALQAGPRAGSAGKVFLR